MKLNAVKCNKCGHIHSTTEGCPINNLTTEQQLKDDCTPDDIKCMVELAEGFEWSESIHFGDISSSIKYSKNGEATVLATSWILFPLLIHRAVEGWNKKFEDKNIWIGHKGIGYIQYYNPKDYEFKNYQPQSLTQAECAMLHCLLDIFKEERE